MYKKQYVKIFGDDNKFNLIAERTAQTYSKHYENVEDLSISKCIKDAILDAFSQLYIIKGDINE